MTVHSATTVWRRVCIAQGLPTELLGITAASGSPRLQVVVIPGNPGSAIYFQPFMRNVYDMLGGEADVLAVTHAGHDPQIPNPTGKVWSLREQVAHKVAFLREHVLLPGRPPVVLVGHSIGAAMMIKAVAELEGLRRAEHDAEQAGGAAQQQQQQQQQEEGDAPNLLYGQQSVSPEPAPAAPVVPYFAAEARLPPIVKMVAVFPFFETNFPGNARQRRLRLLAPYHDLLGWVGAAVTSLPEALRLGFVALNAAMEPDARALTARLLTRHVVRNAFYLAGHEFKDLSQPWDWALMCELGPRLHVMGCEHDTWLSRQQYDAMCERVPGLQATWHPDLRHAFCISQRQSMEAAEHVVESVVRPLLRAAAAAAAASPAAAGAELSQWGSAVLRGSPSAVSVSHGPASPSPSPSTSSRSRSSGWAADTEDTASGAQQAHTHSHHLHQQQPHHGPHGDQQAVLYGQTAAVRRHMYGDDVTGSARHDASAAAAAAVAAATRSRSRGGAAGVSDDDIELDVFDDGGRTAGAAAVTGAGRAGGGKLAQRGAAAATASSTVAVLASSGAAAAVAAAGVVTRSMARRQKAAGVSSRP
ncbi:hypothetical protein HYH02_002443 [Chlamydomonas schloesseri]|uniref:Uncharacterized protein n=1 Tax=Chlamydomonas schloesseri TaxID=2026947 RepID=A0A836BAZ4_9CHLO|nr:hypothetical protein HYH02_002443 [Chlamydomonas schloesseri]|eukprot:KAG2453112.1 hypothetical protein HYH02_002443 [Chlamydomonas schloesseri]